MKTHTIIEKRPLFKSSFEKRAARESYIISIANWCGLGLFAGLTAFFLCMKAFGLHQILAFRFLNFVFMVGALLIAYFSYMKKFDYKGIRFLTGIKMGIHINLLGTFLFALFMFGYLYYDADFMRYIQENGEFGEYLTPMRAAGGVFMEGFATGAILTFSLMLLFKDEEFNPNLEK
jgi:hypothetical protein